MSNLLKKKPMLNRTIVDWKNLSNLSNTGIHLEILSDFNKHPNLLQNAVKIIKTLADSGLKYFIVSPLLGSSAEILMDSNLELKLNTRLLKKEVASFDNEIKIEYTQKYIFNKQLKAQLEQGIMPDSFGKENYLFLEIDNQLSFERLVSSCFQLQVRNYRPVLLFSAQNNSKNSKLLESLKSRSILFYTNLLSTTGANGWWSKRKTIRLLKDKDIYNFLGTGISSCKHIEKILPILNKIKRPVDLVLDKKKIFSF